MKIGLIGAGRLGLCLALLMDKAGYSVIASDVSKDYIDGLQWGEVTTTEPGACRANLPVSNPISALPISTFTLSIDI